MPKNDKSPTVTQDNELIEACYSMTLREKRVLLLGMSKINPQTFPTKGEPFQFSITVDEWRKYFPQANVPWRTLKHAASGF